MQQKSFGVEPSVGPCCSSPYTGPSTNLIQAVEKSRHKSAC